ncbi:MAG: ABC transporter substrate-binding protein [Acidimicrobiales bacterium]
MQITRSSRRALAVSAALALGLAACTTKDDDDTSTEGGDGGGGGEVATGPGVTDDTITLGMLVDLHGPYAALGQSVSRGVQLYWDERNADGGVCDREVELESRDHGYDAQAAVSFYSEIHEDILALQNSLGSPMTTALLPDIEADAMLTLPVSWASSLLENPYIVMGGTTYDLEIVNGISWLMENEGLEEGATVGHIYAQGEYGENGLRGSQIMADRHGFELVDEQVQGTQSDMTSQVNVLQQAGAEFVMLTVTPTQAASAVQVAESNGYDMTFLGSNPTFVPSLLDGPAADGLAANFFLVSSYSPFSSEADGPTMVRDAYKAEYPDETYDFGPMFGYAQAQVLGQIIDAACEAGDITREGLTAAFEDLSEVDTEGLIAPLDYSTEQGVPPANQVYVAKPNAEVEGGLEVVQELFASEDAEDYEPVGG